MNEAKALISAEIERLIKAGVRKTVIEIDLIYHIKRELSKEDE